MSMNINITEFAVCFRQVEDPFHKADCAHHHGSETQKKRTGKSDDQHNHSFLCIAQIEFMNSERT